MLGFFDSGHGGLTIVRGVRRLLPQADFIYLGDHAHAPYGKRSRADVFQLTKEGVDYLFTKGCTLVVLACNTATAVALRSLQQEWLPQTPYTSKNVLGVIAPTVEVATQQPWVFDSPSDKEGAIAVFGTLATTQTKVYTQEIKKRRPNMHVWEVACADLAGLIEANAAQEKIEGYIKAACDELVKETAGHVPHEVILGCTHYELVRDLFEKHLPAGTHVLGQPELVAQSLADYLKRHNEYTTGFAGSVRFLTTGNSGAVSQTAARFMGAPVQFEAVD